MGKHKNKNKNKDGNCRCNGNCEGGHKCRCGDQCKCRECEHLHVENEAEMIRLLNLILIHGKKKEEEYKRKQEKMSNDLLIDAGVTAGELIAPPNVVEEAEIDPASVI